MVKNDYLKEFMIKLQSLDKSKRIQDIFKDFLSLSVYAIMQPFYRSPDIEQKYLDIIGKYTKEQANDFSQMLALLVNALEQKYQDFLGQVFMQLNLGNSTNGQFFTPYYISSFMSKITFSNSEHILKNKNIITLSEPCCGSGGMVIAFAETMKQNGYNYQNQLFVEAIDIDELCFKMTYIQLSLYGVPAKVMLGDTLSYKFSQIVYTPTYFLNGFILKINNLNNNKESLTINQTQAIQLNLF